MQAAPRRFLRIAFDIGSGATKVCGAIVKTNGSSNNTSIEKVLYEREQVLLIGQAVKHESADGKTIPSGTVTEIQTCVEGMIAEVHRRFQKHQEDATVAAGVAGSSSGGVVAAEGEERVGIATAIFRVAANGQSVLESLAANPETRMRCSILSQDDEAALGFETARQYMLANEQTVPRDIKEWYYRSSSSSSGDDGNSNANMNTTSSARRVRLVSYDSGAASFQLCTEEGGAAHPLRYFNGQWGSTISHLALMKVAQQARADGVAETPNTQHPLDPNPLGPVAAQRFHEHILADLNDEGKHPKEEREYFRALFADGEQYAPPPTPASSEATRISDTSSKNTTAPIVLLQAFGGNTSAFNMCHKVFNGAYYIDRAALWDKIIGEYALLPYEAIEARGFVQPEVLLAKLILVYTVMTHLGIRGMHFQMAIGNTRALVGTDKFWTQTPPQDCAAAAVTTTTSKM